ncbi:MAG: hypothetical protein M4579_006032 [Chaenotheca gracillima]|nr:MAG: hypothetical protein M4579_006032 [Chaenotheca gracillima]
MSLPKNWPADITYLQSPIYSPTLTTEDLEAITITNPDQAQPQPSPPSAAPSPLVKIHSITNTPAHPANTQHGLFATRNLRPGTFLLDYLGHIHAASETDPASRYDLSLDAERGIGIDATRMGNEARFLNDYRGVREEGPNCEFRERVVDAGVGRSGSRGVTGAQRRVGIFVCEVGKSGRGRKGVRKGEELVVNYGKGFWRGS